MLGDCIADLKPFQKLSIEEYGKDRIAQAVVERKLQLAAEICLDIGSHRSNLPDTRVILNSYLTAFVANEATVRRQRSSRVLRRRCS